MSDCIICDKHKQSKVPFLLEGESTYVFHYETSEKNPKTYKGHLFVEPKRHITSVADLTPVEAQELGFFISKAGKALRAVLDPEHIYVFTIGHLVDHLHFHVVPRYAGTPKEYWGGMKLHEWENAPFIGEQDISDLSSLLMKQFTECY